MWSLVYCPAVVIQLTGSLSYFALSDLDFLESIKLVNYVRSQVRAGNMSPNVSSKDAFADDAYLKPVLEDDALLYSLDEVEDVEDKPSENPISSKADSRVQELQEELEDLRQQFSEYRLAVQKSMEEQLSAEDDKLAAAGPSASDLKKIEDTDSDYFSSYSYNCMEPCGGCGFTMERFSDMIFALQLFTRLC